VAQRVGHPESQRVGCPESSTNPHRRRPNRHLPDPSRLHRRPPDHREGKIIPAINLTADKRHPNSHSACPSAPSGRSAASRRFSLLRSREGVGLRSLPAIGGSRNLSPLSSPSTLTQPPYCVSLSDCSIWYSFISPRRAAYGHERARTPREGLRGTKH
jgi:hypothetical protein